MWEEQLALLPEYLAAHVRITLLVLLVGAGVSIPLGVSISRVRWLEPPVLALAGIIQTIPGLALLAIMVPLLALVGAQSIGFIPAFLGLTLYSVLPILRNTVTGIAGVDPAMIEAARGVGMTSAQRLRMVELPLALPVIMAGLRTATVWVVGTATLSTPVGATSLGNYIFAGLQTRNHAAVLVGCISAAALALVLDAVLRLVQDGLERGDRIRVVGGAVAVALMASAAVAWGPLSSKHPQRDGDTVVIGTKTFTEQYILGEVLAGRVESRTGRRTRLVSSLGSTVAFEALASDEIDVYVDYTGTIWATIMRRGQDNPGREAVLGQVRETLWRSHGITLVAPLGFENAYALAMRKAQADALGIRSIGDLQEHAPRLTIGGDYEFFGRPEWAQILDTYDLGFAKQRTMDSSLMYQAVAQGDVDVISAFSTDGRIDALDLVLLDDERSAIPPYDAVILASPRLAAAAPRVIEALESLGGSIDAETMRAMNRQVDEQGTAPRTVARQFLGKVSHSRTAGNNAP